MSSKRHPQQLPKMNHSREYPKDDRDPGSSLGPSLYSDHLALQWSALSNVHDLWPV